MLENLIDIGKFCYGTLRKNFINSNIRDNRGCESYASIELDSAALNTTQYSDTIQYLIQYPTFHNYIIFRDVRKKRDEKKTF